MAGLYIIDAMSQVYRAFFTPGPELSAPDGTPTKVVYFFTRMLMKLVREQQPSHLVVCFDSKRSTLFRTQLYPAYKGNRVDAPGQTEPDIEKLYLQVGIVKELLALLGVSYLRIDGFEADDIIATLAHRHAAEAPVVIVSRDKDLEQLLSDRVRMYDPMVSEWRTAETLWGDRGLKPEQMIEFQALIGDMTDNIPGARGIGEVTAAQLLAEYGSLDKIWSNRDKLSMARRMKLERGWEQVQLNLKLVSLVQDIDLGFTDLACLEFSKLNLAAAAPRLAQLGIQRLASTVSGLMPQ